MMHSCSKGFQITHDSTEVKPQARASRQTDRVNMCAQGVLSWVGQAVPGREPPRFEARLYDKLFKTSSVADTGDDWLEDLNPQSLTTVEGALATPRLAAAKAGDKYVPSCPSVVAAQDPQNVLYARVRIRSRILLSVHTQREWWQASSTRCREGCDVIPWRGLL